MATKNYMADFRQRRDMRRDARDRYAVEDFTARADRAMNERNLRSQRSRYIDSIPGLTNTVRGKLHHSSHTRANAGDFLPTEYATRLREYDDALAVGARSIDDYRMTRNAIDRDTTMTNYVSPMLDSQVKQGNAKAKADNALAKQRRAQANETDAMLPGKVDRQAIDNAVDTLGAAGVAAGEFVPPGYEEVTKPAPMNKLDEARARNLDASTGKLIREMATKPKAESTRLRAQSLERILARDSDASPSEKDWARQELASMATRLADDGELGIRVAQDKHGQKVYEITPGQWVYEDGRAYVDPDAAMEKIIEGMTIE